MQTSEVCFAFEVHQPYRIDFQFNPEFAKRKRNLRDAYFAGINREILQRVVEKCYMPATQIVLEGLDAGFKCAFSFSGTVVEQLERWNRDTLELFRQAAEHKNAEILAQTYYHSIASLFGERSEFEEQVKLHIQLMKDVFGVKPEVFENTELIFDSMIATVAKELGFKAVFAEGAERFLEGRSPNYVYSCNGIKILLRNYTLSDDIAFRFSSGEWDQYPLTADKYADWLAATPGDCVNIFVDYETFGEHHWKESGILDFLRWLPHECMKRGIEFATPSEVAELQAVGEIDVSETISWADVEKDTSAWLGNWMQSTAFRAVKRAKAYAEYYNPVIWRYLQTSDHFYYMATKQGSSGEVHNYFSQHHPFEAFSIYMRVLSHYEERCSSRMKSKQAAIALRSLPPEKAFHFRHFSGDYAGSAYSLDDFASLLRSIPVESIRFHLENGDFERWIEYVLCDKRLVEEIRKLRREGDVVDGLVEVVEKRRCELWRLLK
ncbi:glycoside hydrolase family 57 protein [Archaeoglobus veneficus]|uniref:Alpha-amylase n=1 Tax=Archaeoglobus veneficus (strain DSM 11195 / SNP6) TaxID=693661 RepID=F2KMM9_ARCVS|nr:glycoside hydrolase family 57 protein [Archaeoglobus veneficus]AEA47226.1 Alpha-amylase [Archaeoglobus veneficus SNP6]